ncbi:MAG: GHKL domain-containing protein [Treponema sp.]|nr:GHKL domain-containing protein [Treponema sp.]
MRNILYNAAEALIFITAISYTIQLIVTSQTRLKAGKFLIYLLVNMAGYFFLGWVSILVIRVVIWAIIVTLLVILFYRMTIVHNIIYISAILILNVACMLILELYKWFYLGPDGIWEWFAIWAYALVVTVLCVVFLLGWNFFSRRTLRKHYRTLRKKLANTPYPFYFKVALLLMVGISAFGAVWISGGILDRDRFASYIPFLIFPILNIIGYLLYKTAIINRIKLDDQKEKYEQILVYTGIVEKLTRDIRFFRHDVNNILLTLKTYIENNDMEGLREYYFREVLGNQPDGFDVNSIFLNIEYIKCIPLKGLLVTAFQRAIQSNIKVSLFIDDYFDETGIQVIDLCRVISIFLDNAIEAAEISKEKVLSFSVIKNENQDISIIIANSFLVKPQINLLFQEGYTTKGTGRGIGLTIIQNILKNYEFVTLNTVIDEEFLIQELNISQTINE